MSPEDPLTSSIVACEPARGRAALLAARERAVTLRRCTADDVRAFLAAGPDAPSVADQGSASDTDLPSVTGRSLDACALDAFTGDSPEASS